MNMWTVILAGLLIVNLGSALEDVGVYVNGTYSQGKFEKRVLPPTVLVCASGGSKSEWWRINLLEKELQNFESRTKIQNATLRLGTPAFLFLMVDTVEFTNSQYCRHLPKAYHNEKLNITGSIISKVNGTKPAEYFAVKVNNTERATIKQGWNYLNNLVKNRFPGISPYNLYIGFVEIAASGQVYVGAIQNYMMRRDDNQEADSSSGIPSSLP